jgi:hypothetical protein
MKYREEFRTDRADTSKLESLFKRVLFVSCINGFTQLVGVSSLDRYH